jgi:hypothetical protein
MFDRIVEGAAELAPSTYTSVHVCLSSSDYETLLSEISTLISALLPALLPLGSLIFTGLPTSRLDILKSELIRTGYQIPTDSSDSNIFIVTKPTYAVSASVALKKPMNGAAPSIPFPRRPVDPSQKSSKQAIWALNSASAPSIDSNALLTESDRVRPTPSCEPPIDDKPKKRKACKGCTCGLFEYEEEERQKSDLVVLDLEGGKGQETKIVSREENEKLRAAAKLANKATSSCGSCYLGDAFRCEGCPYMGLPAFEPGQQVQLPPDTDDLIL